MKTILFIIIILLPVSTFADEKIFFIDNFYSYNSDGIFFDIKPSINFGTHENDIGLNIEFYKNIIGNDLFNFSTGLFSSSRLFAQYYGIPGQSIQSNNGLSVIFSFGKEIEREMNVYNRIHNFEYYISYIFSSDQTSQTYGGIIYRLNIEDIEFIFQLDNDDAYFMMTDKYRTTKGLIGITNSNTNIWGVYLGFNLWTGNLDGTYIQNDDFSYTLDGYGGEYSHGIAYLRFRWNNINLSLGYDDEIIRDLIQNNWHKFYNRPYVPLVEKDGCFYLKFSINDIIYDY